MKHNLVMPLALVLLGVGVGTYAAEVSPANAAETVTIQKSTTVKKSKLKKLSFDSGTYKVKAEKDYAVNSTDNSWSGASVKISKIRVIKIKDAKHNTNGKNVKATGGFIIVNLKTKANRDIDFNPGASTLNTSDGTQVTSTSDSSGSWDETINKGDKVSGRVVYQIKSLKSINQYTSVRMKWDVTDSDGDSNAYTYDSTFNLSN